MDSLDLQSQMENSDSTTTVTPVPLLSSKKENETPFSPKIAELNESREELLNRLQNLKLDLQSWRSKLDTQVNTYRSELSELKKSLNFEVDQLRSEFQGLRTTLQQQQEDVNASLRSLGLQDDLGENKDAKSFKAEVIDKEAQDLPQEEKDEKTDP